MKMSFKIGDHIRYHGKGDLRYANANIIGHTGIIVEDEGVDIWSGQRRWKIKWNETGRESFFGVCEVNIELLTLNYKIDQEPNEDEETL